MPGLPLKVDPTTQRKTRYSHLFPMKGATVAAKVTSVMNAPFPTNGCVVFDVSTEQRAFVSRPN